jgi:hypothetical protein
MAQKKSNNEKAPKKIIYIQKDDKGTAKAKYEVLGKRFIYKGDTFTAQEVVENKELIELLIANKAPAIKKL